MQATYLYLFSCHFVLLTSIAFVQTKEDDFGLPETSKMPETIHIKESAEFQAINSYLTNLKPLTTNNANVITHINNAINKLESLNSIGLNHEDAAEFKILLEDDPQINLTILRNFVSASKSCEQRELNFLVLVMEQQTFKGQFLNEYARNLLEKCWMFNLASLSERIGRSIGKLNSSVFETLAELGNRVSNKLAKEQRAKSGTLTISDQSPPKELAVSLQQLKLVTFETQSQLRTIALALNSMFSNQLATNEYGGRIKIAQKEELDRLSNFYKNSLIVPCEQLVDRVKSASSLITNYNYAPVGERNNLIDSRRASDSTLDYQFEIYRICRQVQANSSNLWNMLSKMR